MGEGAVGAGTQRLRPQVILDLWKKGYEGHIRQYTNAKATHVPFAKVCPAPPASRLPAV